MMYIYREPNLIIDAVLDEFIKSNHRLVWYHEFIKNDIEKCNTKNTLHLKTTAFLVKSWIHPCISLLIQFSMCIINNKFMYNFCW